MPFAQEGERREPDPIPNSGHRSELRQTIESLNPPKIRWSIPQVGGEVQRIRQKNGITLYLKEDHRLPLVQIYFSVRTGKIYEPQEKNGLAGLTGTLMRTGGTQTMGPEEVDRALESLGANLDFSIGLESGSGSLNIRKSDLDLGLKIVAEMLRRPAFDPSRFDLAKLQLKEAIRRRNDSLDAIAMREFRKALYNNHPYGRILEWETVEAIQREDLIEFHRKYFRPNHLYMAVSGDFASEDLQKKLETLFGDWESEVIELPPLPKASGKSVRRILVIPKETNQSRIVYGHFGVNRNHPDIAAVEVLNLILGGGNFTSRITRRVRSDEGLAYSAGTSFPTGTRDLSTFQGWMQTKTGSTHRAIQIALEEVDRIRKEQVTDEELLTAKQIIENRSIFQFSDPWVVVRLLMELDYEERPPNFYQIHLQRLLRVTKEDVQRVARELLRPEEMIILVVGDSEKFELPLSDFGPVEELRLTDPIK
jgi:predicted Zn-dependent peptidase